MKKFLILFSFILLTTCGGKNDGSDLKFFAISSKDFSPYINNKPAPLSPDLTSDKVIHNPEYPIEIALYKDGKWYYDLANLGDGFGTWTYEEGVLKLRANRTILGLSVDMDIDVAAVSESAQDIIIKFTDRFGPKILEMQKKNIEL